MINLDPQQLAAIEASSPTLVNASAGSGKTRCLIAKIIGLLEEGTDPKNILAVTFTNKAANEMKERLKKQSLSIEGMQISTIHSLCVRIIRSFTQYTVLNYPFSIYDESDQLSIIKTIVKSKDLPGDPKEYISIISKAKSKQQEAFLKDDFELVYKTYSDIMFKNNACDFDDLLIYAIDCLKNEDCQKFFHNLWHHILVDEFQDTSIIQYKIVEYLYNRDKTKTLFIVGDLNQCVINGTKIASEKNLDIVYYQPIKEIKRNQKILAASGGSKTFTFPVISKFSRFVTDMPVVTIVTKSGKSLTTTKEHTHFAGYIKETYIKKYFTYLMFKKNYGYRIGVTSTVRYMGKRGSILGYKLRLGQERADFLWLLGAYDTIAEAKYYEQYYSIKYGIPTWIFYIKGRGIKSDYNDFYIKKLFKNIDTRNSAETLLNDLDLSIDLPHHIPKCLSKNKRRNFTIRLCSNSLYNKPFHSFKISGSDPQDENLLKTLDLKVRKESNRRGYRVESNFADLSRIFKIKETIEQILPVNLIQSAKLSDFSLPLIPASYVLPGMNCFIEKNGKIELEEIISVKKSLYTGFIYDLNIERAYNYIANGIVTHNSIYSWRQANPENIDNFKKKYNPSICNLTYNYRCSSNIIKHANNFLQFGKPMTAKSSFEGKVSITQFSSQEDEAEKIASAISKMNDFENTAILFRVNTRTLLFERVFSQRRIPYKIVGALPFYRRKIVKDLISFLKAAKNRSDIESLVRIINVPKRGFGERKKERLLHKGWPYLSDISKEMPLIASFIDLLDRIKTMKPLNAINEILNHTSYRALLNKDKDKILLDSFLDVVAGFNTIEELILASTFIEEDSGYGVKLMTAHASKGLEFDRVFVVGVENGLWPHKFSENKEEEERLFYVACTRAKKYLNISYSKSRIYRGSQIGVTPSNLFIKIFKTIKSV